MNNTTDAILWDDVCDAASRMFEVWHDGLELKWAEDCWDHLTRAGLTSNSSEIEDTRSQLMLLTLARIYREFCWAAWREEAETPIQYLADELNLNEVAVGILACGAKDAEFCDEEDDYELRSAALTYASDSLREEIYNCLCVAYGNEVMLSYAMFNTLRDSDDENDGSLLANSTGLQYVQDGFHPC